MNLFNLIFGSFLCGVCIVSLCFVWDLSGYSRLPNSSSIHVRLTGESKLVLGVNVQVSMVVSLCVSTMQ